MVAPRGAGGVRRGAAQEGAGICIPGRLLSPQWRLLAGFPVCLIASEKLGSPPPRPLVVFGLGIDESAFVLAFETLGFVYGPLGEFSQPDA